MKQLIFITFITFTFSGCVVGTVASVPFKAVGAIIPGAAGTAISTTGDVVDTVIPF